MRKNVVCLMMILLMASSLPINASAGPSDDIPTNAQNTGVHDTLVELLVKADLVTVLQAEQVHLQSLHQLILHLLMPELTLRTLTHKKR